MKVRQETEEERVGQEDERSKERENNRHTVDIKVTVGSSN